MAQFAIGDIHGCITSLKTIFKQQFVREGDTVIFLGDYINRGPDSKTVIDWLLEHKRKYDFIFLRGNHEIMMSEARISYENLLIWLKYGGDHTFESYGITRNMDWQAMVGQAHWDFIDECLPYYITETNIYVHGGMIAGLPPERQFPKDLFWRKYESPQPYCTEKTLICGHTSRKNGKIADFGHTICIDTYAYGGQWLTCLNTSTLDYIQSNEKGECKRDALR